MKQRHIVNASRIRSVGTFPSVYTSCSGVNTAGTFTAGSSPAFATDYVKETLDGSLGRGIPHAVTHIKHKVRISDPGSLVIDFDGGGINRISGFGGQRCGQCEYFVGDFSNIRILSTDPILWGAAPFRWTLPTTVDDEHLLIENCHDKARGLKADVLLNIVEANQALPAVRSLASCLPEMGYNWSRLRKQIRTASGAFLSWKFGVSPILQDSIAIWKYLPKLVDDIRRHKDSDKSRYSSYKTTVASFDAQVEGMFPLNGYNTYVRESQGRINTPSGVRYVLVVRPTVKYYNGIFNALDVVLQRFATGPASLAWEKVPFSFVVDWFVDIRSLLRKVDSQLASPPYEIVSFTRSHCYDVSTDVFIKRQSPCDGTVLTDEHCGTVSTRRYSRSVVPVGFSAPSWNSRFGKNQAAILAALISQKLSGSKRRLGRL